MCSYVTPPSPFTQYVFKIVTDEHSTCRIEYAKKFDVRYQHVTDFDAMLMSPERNTFHIVTVNTMQVLSLNINPTSCSVSCGGNGVLIRTVLHGIEETVNVAKIGDYIICGPSAELYVFKPEVIDLNYDVQSDCCSKQMVSMCTKSPLRVVLRVTDDDLRSFWSHNSGSVGNAVDQAGAARDQATFVAPWGSAMIVQAEDFLVFEDRDLFAADRAPTAPLPMDGTASTIRLKTAQQLERRFYRVERDVFRATYQLVTLSDIQVTV